MNGSGLPIVSVVMKTAKVGFMAALLGVFLVAAALESDPPFQQAVKRPWVWVVWPVLFVGLAVELWLTPRCTLADRSSRRASLTAFVALFGGCAVSVLDYTWGGAMGIPSLGGRHAPWAHWLGVAILAGGFAIIVAGRISLGNEGTIQVCILPEHHLRTGGILGRVRHPIYLGSILKWVGVAVTFTSVLGLTVNLLACSYFAHRIKLEESLLTRQFGDRYEAYAGHTFRLVPFVY